MLRKLIHGTTTIFKEICMDNLTVFVNEPEFRKGLQRIIRPIMLLVGLGMICVSVTLFFYLFNK